MQFEGIYSISMHHFLGHIAGEVYDLDSGVWALFDALRATMTIL
jgi:hypothetical protein